MLASRDLPGWGTITPGACCSDHRRPKPDPKPAIEHSDDTAPRDALVADPLSRLAHEVGEGRKCDELAVGEEVAVGG
jgi:hypothetical protein